MSNKYNITFNDALGKLGMLTADYGGLRFVSQLKSEKNPDLYLALESATDFGATAVYFRFYSNDKPPKPVVYIYDKSSLSNDDVTDATIHHKLWNAGIVPFCFIFRASEVLVFNCGKMPQWDNSGETFTTSPHDLIKFTSDAQSKLDLYKAQKFDSGLFWESDTGSRFNYEQSAYQQLLDQLKKVKSNIISKVGIKNASLVKRVLMMLILIKYLEERKDNDGKGALNPSEFYLLHNAQNPTLEGVLKNADTFLAVLDELSKKEHFNGQIFQLNEGERKALKEIEIFNILRHFIRGDVSFFSEGRHGIGQMSLWRLYQFNYLPIELISHIYEDFLTDINGQNKKGVVYTPPYLVQFLIDQCMPLSKPIDDFKILDPACGSGIFLVGAYKRMIQWWRVKNNWKKPQKEDIEELRELLQDNIYGCDIEGEAVLLTYFSLSLALLDSLSPKEIWGNVHFINLVDTNLFSGDFFKILNEGKLKANFDLVIGNPPFDSKFTEWAQKVDKDERINDPERPEIPDNQIALLFFEQSFKVLKNKGNCCLILPSGPVLYNNGSHPFRKYMFERFYMKALCDFTPLRAKLFIGSTTSAKPAVVTIIAEKSNPEKSPCIHYIFRRTRASGEKVDFEIDHYDIHKVSLVSAINNPRVWQANFMGGGRLHHLLDTVSKAGTLGEFLDEKIINDGWKVAEGWIESPNSKEIKRVKHLASKENKSELEVVDFIRLEAKYKADWITGHNYIETNNFAINDQQHNSDVCNIKYFLRSRYRNKEIFQPPHLLIKESMKDNSLPVLYSNEYLTFKDSIFGIHSPKKDSDELQKIFSYLKDESVVPLLWLLSGKAITSREAVAVKGDILSLPYPPIQFDAIDKILLKDIINFYAEFRIAGEKSVVLTPASLSDLDTFGELYCRILNSIYTRFKPLSPIKGKEFIAFPFVLGDNPELDIPTSIEEIESELKVLIDSKQEYNLWIKRIVKVYHKNVIFLYKPNQKRYWLPSIAIRDADETFLDLFKQGK